MSNPGHLWFLQIQAQDSTDLPNPVLLALRSFYQLIWEDVEPDIVSHPLDFLDLERLIEVLSQRTQPQPICVFGTFDQKGATAYSWEQLGLNLFDLPWHDSNKVFRYIPLLQLPQHLSDLHHCLAPDQQADKQEVVLNYEMATEQLKWARCHQFTRKIQTAVGHGNRDKFQDPAMTWNKICLSLNQAYQSYPDLPCGDLCGLKQRIRTLTRQFVEGEQHRLEFAQQVAALDCHLYRLAPTQYFFPSQAQTLPKFRKIIVLENDPTFRDFLSKELEKFLEPGGDVVPANLEKSQENFRLCDENGENLLCDYIKKQQIEPGKILACFDLDLGQNKPKSGMQEFLNEVFGGHWIMYGTASQSDYANVPRLIITGFRSEELLGYTAGGCAYLLKPFTQKTLEAQVTRASVLHRVKWLCPSSIQDQYSNLFGNTGFDTFRAFLGDWLSRKRIDLAVIEDFSGESRSAIAESSLIILDLFPHNGLPVLDPLETISQIRQVNNRASLLIVLPGTESSEDIISDYYRKLPLSLRNGTDTIIKKPMWLTCDGHPNPEHGLGDLIIQQLNRFNEYDVKYQVLIPVAAIIGRCDKHFFDDYQYSKEKDVTLDKLYAPLLPILVNNYALSANLQDLEKLKGKLQGDLTEQLTSQLIRQLKDETNQEENEQNLAKQEEIKNKVREVIQCFIDSIDDASIQDHLTLEAWLYKSVNHEVENSLSDTQQKDINTRQKDINTLTEPLTKVFGGATRYEFSARGSWYKGSDKIDDLLIVIEFCAKSSLAAKKFIETTVVRYLRKVAKEDCVLVQEIPIHGYLS